MEEPTLPMTPGTFNIKGQGKVGVADVISALHENDGSFAAQEQRVADFVKENLDAVSTMTNGELAERCGVSAPTVIRFCRSLGCEGYRDFKLRLAQNLAVSRQYFVPPVRRPTEGEDGIAGQVLDAVEAATRIMRQQLDYGRLDEAKSAITACRQLLVGGIGGGASMLAGEAANRFFRLGIPSLAISDSYLMQMRAATLGPQDVLLLFSSSGEADAVVGAARIAGGYGATTISITKPGTNLSSASAIALTVDLPEDPDIFKPTASRYAYLAIVDMLAMSVAQAEPDRTRENLRRIRASLTAYHGRTGPQPLGD